MEDGKGQGERGVGVPPMNSDGWKGSDGQPRPASTCEFSQASAPSGRGQGLLRVFAGSVLLGGGRALFRVFAGSALPGCGQVLLRVADGLLAGAVRAIRREHAHQHGRPDLGLLADDAAAKALFTGWIDHGRADLPANPSTPSRSGPLEMPQPPASTSPVRRTRRGMPTATPKVWAASASRPRAPLRKPSGALVRESSGTPVRRLPEAPVREPPGASVRGLIRASAQVLTGTPARKPPRPGVAPGWSAGAAW